MMLLRPCEDGAFEETASFGERGGDGGAERFAEFGGAGADCEKQGSAGLGAVEFLR